MSWNIGRALVAAGAAFAQVAALAADSKALQDEASKLLKDKAYAQAAEKFLDAAKAEKKAPRRIHWGFS